LFAWPCVEAEVEICNASHSASIYKPESVLK
jgi:hypothetical protein